MNFFSLKLLMGLSLILTVMMFSEIILINNKKDQRPEKLCLPKHKLENPENENLGCHDNKTDVVVIVLSSVKNFKSREAIRQTWGNASYYKAKGYSVRMFFILGMISEKGEQLKQKLNDEKQKFGDIVVSSSTELYSNLVHKHIFGIHFLATRCQSADIVLKTDDDVFVDIIELVNYLRKKDSQEKSLWCKVFDGYPDRNPHSKFFTPMNIYSAKYPLYCAGSYYVTKLQTVKLLSQLANCQPFYHFEDVHITGHMRTLGNISIHNMDNQLFIQSENEQYYKSVINSNEKMVVYHHKLTVPLMKYIWQKIAK